jgi:hypothetical protein
MTKGYTYTPCAHPGCTSTVLILANEQGRITGCAVHEPEEHGIDPKADPFEEERSVFECHICKAEIKPGTPGPVIMGRSETGEIMTLRFCWDCDPALRQKRDLLANVADSEEENVEQ